jgi:hypothetical protein
MSSERDADLCGLVLSSVVGLLCFYISQSQRDLNLTPVHDTAQRNVSTTPSSTRFMTASHVWCVVQLPVWRQIEISRSTVNNPSVNLLIYLRRCRLGYDTMLVWSVAKKGSMFLQTVVAHLLDYNTVLTTPRTESVCLSPWKPHVIHLSLYWSTVACRRGGKGILIRNLTGWRLQVLAVLCWEWATIKHGVGGVGLRAAGLNMAAKQRMTFGAGSRIRQCLTSTDSPHYCTTNYVLLSGCFWVRACDIIICGVQLFCSTLLIGIYGGILHEYCKWKTALGNQ